ncbi:hypothetical protein FACS189460_3450 [Deltaproteobacteria bacterium]|nr:hypothetical protein FACS189460_3450 [Deltaproteobacteria bacterium]
MPVKKFASFWALAGWLAAGLALAAWPRAAEAEDQGRQHLVFWAGTPQEVEVYKIAGREKGPTVMIIGGIQGDEPGGFLSADLYAGVTLKRGNLIVVPRANAKSIRENSRGSDGDLNRKFQGDLSRDPDRNIVELLKSLMRESDLLLNLHDGSGYYRPTYESDLANPNRYGQSVIADADAYIHEPTGRVIPLAHYAEEVIGRVNQEIGEPLYRFHFFNTNTGAADSPYKEQRRSATYYALTQAGIPAFGIETSKQLPRVEMKVYQHNLAVTAFLDIFGVELDRPGLALAPPELGYVVIAVGEHPPLAVSDGQTLWVAQGETITVADVAANYDRGLAVDVQGLEDRNTLGRPLNVERPLTITVRKDQTRIGRINIDLLPSAEASGAPRLSPPAQIRSARAGRSAILETNAAADPGAGAPDGGPSPADGSGQAGGSLKAATGRVTGFLVEVDGRTAELSPGQVLETMAGSLVTMMDLKSDGDLPPGVVMNLRGFVPLAKQTNNDGEDRGYPADTGRDMRPAFSAGGRGQQYNINAELGKTVLASAVLKIAKPRLESVTFAVDGRTQTLKAGERAGLPAGAAVTLTEVKLAGGLSLSRPRYTLGGRPLAPELPQTLAVPAFAANLAVYNGDTLAGKVTWAPH